LMLERSGTMAFAGGAVVFPGGAVDEADRTYVAQLAARGHPGLATLEPDDAAARIAAVRETIEEAGLVIGVAGHVDAERAARARADLLAGAS
ncbi:hypothetical protein ABTM19_19830, partial [Acinetobacter baumannii]